MKKPLALIILDGFGYNNSEYGNAIAAAQKPNLDRLFETWPHTLIGASGLDVGLPDGQMGNSEVGHTNIGAGRVVAMDLGQIDLAVEDGSFATNGNLREFCAKLKKTGGTAHLMGVVSDGGVHGHITHLIAAVNAVSEAGVPVVIHAITDGRDVAPDSAQGFIAELQAKLPETARIGTVIGRYFAMDRDQRWDRVERACRAMIGGIGMSVASAAEAVKAAYARGETDEFIPPSIVDGYSGASDADGLLCLNFRADRAREILSALADPDFADFDLGARPQWAALLGMVDYSDRHSSFMPAIYPKQKIANTLGAWVASKGLRQFRLAETEKYPHVTFFLNGGTESPEPGEDRHMPKSPAVATYDLAPQMSAREVSDKLVEVIAAGYDLIVVNFANPDMVGHTGDLAAAKAACEAVDEGLGRMLDALTKAGGAAIICADHGNCETMIDPVTGRAHTAHTTNPVPVIMVNGPEGAGLRRGKLADLAPTVLELMGLDKPAEMTGQSLIRLPS